MQLQRMTLGILAALTLAAAPAPQTMTWTSEKYGLRVTHPTRWTQELGVCGEAMLGLRMNGEPGDEKRRFRGVKPGTPLLNPLLFILGTPAPAGAATADDVLEPVRAIIARDFPGGAEEIRKPTRTTIAGLPALKVLLDAGEKVPIRVSYVFTVHDGAIIGTKLMSSRSEFAGNDQAATDVLKTFQWTKDATTRPAK